MLARQLEQNYDIDRVVVHRLVQAHASDDTAHKDLVS